MSGFRFRRGQVNLVPMPVGSDTVIAAGDMVWMETTGEIFPASDFTWDTNIATTQAAFANVFAGIARESSAAGDTDDVHVDVSPDSVYAYPCASATFKAGAAVGPAKQSGNAMENQKVVGAVGTSSCGRTVESKTAAVTEIRVSFASALHAHNTNAVVG